MYSHSRSTGSSRPTALAIVAIVGLLGLFHASSAQATLVVRLEQIGGPAVAVSGTQTIITAALKVSGSTSVLNTSGFSTVLTWSSSNSAVTNLYTVTSSGVASSSVNPTVTTPGFLYAESSPIGIMNATSLASNSQRYVAVSADPTQNVVFNDVTIMTVRFGVPAGISSANFNFSLNTTLPDYGFTDPDNNDLAFAFTNGGGTIAVVPEPTMPAVFVVFGLIAVGYRARGRFRATKGAAAA
jgi:polyisoprenoid-binding protein YceI